MLKAILDQHRNKNLGFCHNCEMDALIYYVIQQNALCTCIYHLLTLRDSGI